MICGIGVDAVAIKRFVHWHHFSQKRLSKIFTPYELTYVFANPVKMAERLATRFAAKEALYKAISGLFEPKSLYACAKYIGIEHACDQKPFLVIDWEGFLCNESDIIYSNSIKTHVSLTHTEEIAIAYVILENEVFKPL